MITSRSRSILDEDNSTPRICSPPNKPISSAAASPLYGDGGSATTAAQAKNPALRRVRQRATRRFRSIGERQPTHDELDPVPAAPPPRFDLRHVGRFGEALEPFARLGASFVTR